jgi:hypothetical protein
LKLKLDIDVFRRIEKVAGNRIKMAVSRLGSIFLPSLAY